MTNPFTYLTDLTDLIPEVPPDSITSRTVHDDAQVKVILFRFAAGQGLSEHTSPRAAALYFIQGQAALTLGDEAREAQPGTWVHMSPSLPHSILAETDTLMLLMIFQDSDLSS